MKQNLFSRHDNRHTLQSCGEYFGQGLGKRIEKDPVRNQHHSDNHTSWSSKLSYSSTYRQGYGRESSTGHRRSVSAGHQYQSPTLRTDAALLSKYHILTKPNFRRFPHQHTLPGNLDNMKSEDLVSTMLWYSNHSEPQETPTVKNVKDGRRLKSYTTPLAVLAATQQPFLGHSPWKYSYKQ